MTRLYTAAVDRSRIAVPYRQVRAVWDAQSITVYQAYGPAIAEPAIAAGRFVAPFSRSRMTWVKPSFLWMMYRSGWATKPGQERVLAMSRSGFEEALGLSCLSHMDPAVHNDREQWVALKARSPVRIQWDPERDTSLNPLPYRSLQVGIGPGAVDDYVDHWVLALRDITDEVARLRALLAEWHEAHARVQSGDVFLLSPSAARYDLIFLDPPFAAGLHAQAVTHFVNDRWLKEQGKVYLEMPFPHEDLHVPPGWLWHRQGRAGRVFFGLLRRDYADEAAA